MQKVELPDEIKKKSFSQSVQAVVQSSDLICFQGPFCFLLSCCASNRATAMGNINPCDAARICYQHQWSVKITTEYETGFCHTRANCKDKPLNSDNIH